MTGCWVRSVYPFYEDSDVVVDQGLAGTWAGDGELKNCALAISLDADDRTYTLEVTNSDKTKAENRCVAGEDSRGQSISFTGQLVQIGTKRFLDIMYRNQDGLDMLLRVETEKQALALTPLDSEWMANAMEGKRVKLEGRPVDLRGSGTAAFGDIVVTLVSTTNELRDFLRQYGDDKGAFSETSRMTFLRK